MAIQFISTSSIGAPEDAVRNSTKCKFHMVHMKFTFPPWTWILGLQLALVLPFVGQPIHIDDSVYVDIGRNVLKTPWQAHDFPYIFEGRIVADMASHSHPPFVGYWIGLLL